MKLLHLITKNTSSIDFILPVYWKLTKTDPSSNVIIFYGVLNKSTIVGEGTYYDRVLNEIRVKQIDLLDLAGNNNYLYKVLAFLDVKLSQSSINVSRDDLLNSEQWFIRLHKIVLYAVSVVVRNIIRRMFSYVINSKNLSNILHYDLALVDNRASVKFSGDRAIFNYIFEESQKPVVILPHAPHYVDQFFSHVSVNPFGQEMHEKCDIWMPFLPATPVQKKPELEKQLFYSGYPGFDSEWIDYNKSMNESDANHGKTCILYIGRKFLDKNIARPDGYDFVTMDYKDVLNELNMMHDSLVANNCDYLLIFKPHPSSSLPLVEKILNECKINHYKIVSDASYSFLGDVSLVISPYSTAFFVFLISGIPTIILESKMTTEVSKRWSTLGDLYEGLSLFIKPDRLANAINSVLSGEINPQNDVNYCRQYFEDNALSNILDRIDFVLSFNKE